MISAADIARARARLDVIGAEVPLKRQGRELAGCCPFHQEKTPSFFVVPEKGFFHCHGCGAHGDAIEYVKRTRHLGFAEAVRELIGLPVQRPAAPQHRENRVDPAPEPDTAAAIAAILAQCRPVDQTTEAGVYLAMRGLQPRDHFAGWPGLHAHPALYCHEIRGPLPALVAPITNSRDEITALQRIWVARRIFFDGQPVSTTANRPELETRKKSLGRLGDGAVRLAPAAAVLGLAEGVETALAARRKYRLPVWAICGTARFGFPAHWRETRPAPGERARIWVRPERPPHDVAAHQVDERAPSVWIPPEVSELIIFGDHGLAGETCAQHAADWFTRHGLPAEAMFPAEPYGDFNDELLGGAS